MKERRNDMKRYICLFAAAILAAAGTSVYASPGDTAGDYYSTDISTSLNGCEIDAINIGGNTLISAEDMVYYSFSVEWSQEERTLRVNSVPNAVNGAPPTVVKSDLPAGSVLGQYYETDIVTYLDGEPIEAYNIGGRTYIHAEAMRSLGYEVIWDTDARTLSITSPDRTGHVYNEQIARQMESDGTAYDGEGSMAFEYTPYGVTGRSDAEACQIALGADGKNMYVHISHYGSSSYPSELFRRMREIAYTGNIPVQYAPEDRYADVSAITKITVNGTESNQIAVMQTQGNNHTDYIFRLMDIPVYSLDEIESLTFEFGTPTGESYALQQPNDIITDDAVYIAEHELKKYPNDFLQTYYATDEYFAIYMFESPSLGVIKDRLYIYDRVNKSVSGDILDQVRQYEGFNYDILHPFAFEVRDVKTNLFFSVKPLDVSKDLYVDMTSGTVYER